ncbi:probable inactive patatin-like protein 9 [Glycine max]|nr:probable inactive patatin-like protein 9 [Glycine max]|eukprot:XP_006588209.1 probable inactive patatin-like protein 9 [Glycine max]
MRRVHTHLPRLMDQEDSLANPLWKRIWKFPVQEKLRFFLWQFVHAAFLTNERRFLNHLSLSSACLGPYLAPSTTPSLFTPFHFSSIDGKTSCAAIDGGLVMNNSAAAAVTHVLHNKRDFLSVNNMEDLLVLSIRNGAQAKRMNNAGECSTSMVVDIALDDISETVDQMLGNAFCWNRTDYVRIQDEEILHTIHRWEIALVVEDLRDGSCCRIVHHQAAIDGGA